MRVGSGRDGDQVILPSCQVKILRINSPGEALIRRLMSSNSSWLLIRIRNHGVTPDYIEDMTDLGGADAEGQSPEGSVGAGVTVAADDDASRLGGTQLGADDVDDAAVLAVHVVQLDAGLAAVAGQARRPPKRRR